jgi:hypothetical protein
MQGVNSVNSSKTYKGISQEMIVPTTTELKDEELESVTGGCNRSGYDDDHLVRRWHIVHHIYGHRFHHEQPRHRGW